MPAFDTRHVDRAPALHRRRDEIVDVRLVADVAADEAHGAVRADLFDGAAARILVDVGDDDARTVGREAFGDGEADPLRSAGDDRDLVLKRHLSPPCGRS